MLRYFIFLSFSFLCFSNEFSFAITENDPSSFVEGVSVISGDLYTLEEDYVVQGAEPIRMRRSYLSREGGFKDYQHLTAVYLCAVNQFVVNEPNGTSIFYYPDPQNHIFPEIGKKFYGEKKKRRKSLRYNALTQDDRGVSNTKNGEISAQSNIKNQYISFDPNVDHKGKSFTLHSADGTIKKYIAYASQEKTKDSFGEYYLEYFYKLVSETLPNGHMVHYHWNKKNRLERITTGNFNQTKTFASITIPVFDRKNPPGEITLHGSDQRSVTYKGHPTEIKRSYVISDLLSPDLPDQKYGWDILKKWGGKDGKLPYLVSYSLPNHRNLRIEYDDTDEHRVRAISAPVGKDAALLKTHEFFYDIPNRSSYVLDLQNNKTAYFWNNDYRLIRVERFISQNQMHSADLFFWNKNLLKGKAFLNEKGEPLFYRKYLYDPYGNVQEEIVYGNLSGEGPPCKINSEGLVEDERIESFTKKSWYSEDGKNLLLKQSGSNDLQVNYTYWQNTHLPHTKAICKGAEEQILHRFTYDTDWILISEKISDKICTLEKRMIPYQDGPYIGLCEIVEERDGQGALLSKTRFEYGAGAQIKRKDIFDANDVLRYSLVMEYDAKGRLISETNAIGQIARYTYDDAGNLIYSKDFSGRLETHYEYDYSNRLIQKTERGDDGLARIYQYGYDVKHNLISEIDPYGNETKFVPDPFGNQTEIHLSPIRNEKGELISSVTTQVFDAAGNCIEKTDPEGNTTISRYNAYNKPISIIHPDGTKEQFTYYLDGNLQTHTDAAGVVTKYEYDYLDRVTKKARLNAVETFCYEGRFLKKKTDSEGNETLYDYDAAGRKKKETFGGEEITYEYDEFGRTHQTQTGDLVTVTEYDLLGRVIEERTESKEQKVFTKIQYKYDADGNQSAIIRNIQGQDAREEHTYDSLKRLIEKKDPMGFVQTYRYDTEIHQKTHTDAMGLMTIETYNEQNHLAAVEKKKEGKTLFLEEKFYNRNGQLCLQIDEVLGRKSRSRNQTRWEYDSRNRLSTLTEGATTLNAKVTKYTYTPQGKIATLTKPNGVTLIYTYDDLGYLKTLDSSDDLVHHRMEYNLVGHLQKSEAFQRRTDPFGRIVMETFSPGYSIENRYDNQGRRSVCTLAQADCIIEYGYDPAHLKTIKRKSSAGTLYTHAYLEYDLSGNVLSEKSLDGNITTFSTDLLGRKYSIQSLAFEQKALEFDGAGNLLSMDHSVNGIAQYAYDDLYQLISESGLFTHTYSFDSLHNRLQKDDEIYEINALNQVISHNQYNLNGNPIKLNGMSCQYDALDRLILLEMPNFVQTFRYDCLNRCIAKTTNGKTEYFLYDGQNEIGSLDEDLNLKELRVLGSIPHAEIGASVAIELNGHVYTPLHDLQGNITALCSPHSQTTYYSYSAFGEEEIVGETVCPWRFSSKRTDSETRLVNFGRRFYDPRLGRWLTPDPEKFVDGMNLYAYVHNNPLTHFDDYGLLMSARDYETVRQIASAPWEEKRPWEALSTFGRFLGAKAAYEMHNTFLAPLTRDLHRGANALFPNSFPEHRTESRIHEEQSRIMSVFGMDALLSTRIRGSFSAQGIVEGYIPFGPGALSTLSKVRQVGTKIFANPSALSPIRKFVGRKPLADNRNARNPIWTSTKQRTSVQNAYRHWKDHGQEFPELLNSKQYVEATRNFVNNPPPSTLIKTRLNGEMLLYNPQLNTFSVITKDGVPKTMFKPTAGITYWETRN